MSEADRYTAALAELVVRLGANVQPGQIVALASEPGKEALGPGDRGGRLRRRRQVRRPDGVRRLPQACPRAARRARHARATSRRGWVSGCWRWANSARRGSRCPGRWRPTPRRRRPGADRPRHAAAGPRVDEGRSTTRTTNWTIVPCPTPAWAKLVHPGWSRRRRWSGCGRRSRTSAGWTSPTRSPPGSAGSTQLSGSAGSSTTLRLDAVRFEGPGTDLTIGLLPSSRWLAAEFRPSTGSRTAQHPDRRGVHDAGPRAGRRHRQRHQAAVHVRARRSPGSRSGSRAAARSRSRPSRAPRWSAG